MTLDTYIGSLIGQNVLQAAKEAGSWPALETMLAQVYFGVAAFFAPPLYERVPATEDTGARLAIPALPRPEGVEEVRYVAANFRGLFRRNGRETLLAPFGDLQQSHQEVEAHRSLHEVYMAALSRKVESVNQLFLATTTLDALRVNYSEQDRSRVDLENTHGALIALGTDVSSIWADVQERWLEITTRALANHRDAQLSDTLKRELSDTRDGIAIKVRANGASLLASPFFAEWLALPHEPRPQSGTEAAERFQQWILGLSWLAFYCCPTHAGPHFYAIRVPSVIETVNNGRVLPDSSLSIVAGAPLPDSVVGHTGPWLAIHEVLEDHQAFKSLKRSAADHFRRFASARIQSHLAGEEGNLARFVAAVPTAGARGQVEDGTRRAAAAEEAGNTPDMAPGLTVDYSKLDFLVRMSRQLVAARHEGEPLHFCFIFGFSWERVDSESRGVLVEVVSDLRTQWRGFWEKAVLKSAARKLGLCNVQDGCRQEPCRPEVHCSSWSNELARGAAGRVVLALVADGMAKWIKTGDLPLQPWDVALFFEEDGETEWPVPAAIVEIGPAPGSGGRPVSTEFELRSALRALTEPKRTEAMTTPSTTAALLVTHGGLILFVRGKAVLLTCGAGTPYDAALAGVGVWGERTDEDKFRGFLGHLLHQGKFAAVGTKARAGACDMITRLCEALVSLGHGALVVVRAPADTPKPEKLPPLNPAWRIRPHTNAPSPADDMLLYASLAALDGATEIQLPNGEGPLDFSVRKSVVPKLAVWDYDADDDARLGDEFASVDQLDLVGKGTRHHSALALSKDCGDGALVLTVSADGPVTIWQKGKKMVPSDDRAFQARFR